MKTLILRGWTAWRIIRMLLGLVFISAGIYRNEYILIAAGAYLSILSFFNLGCAGGSCNTNN